MKYYIKGAIGTIIGGIVTFYVSIIVMFSVIDCVDSFAPAYDVIHFIPQIIAGAVPTAVVFGMFAFFYYWFLENLEEQYYEEKFSVD